MKKTPVLSAPTHPAAPGNPPATWQTNALLAGLTPALLAQLAPLLRSETHAAGADVLREGDASDRLCLLGAGRVVVVKGSGPEEARLATLAPGSYFGEMGVLTGAPRATTVRAEEAVQVWSLDRAALLQFAAATGFDLLTHSLRNQVGVLSQRLNQTNEVAAESMRERLEEYRMRAYFGTLTVNVILMLFVYVSLLDALRRASVAGSSSTLTTSGLLVVMGIGAGLMVYLSGQKLSAFGLTTHRWRWVLADSLGWSLGFCGLMTLGKLLLISAVPRLAATHLFGIWTVPAGLGATLLAYGLYVLLAPLQEFLTRGILQSSLQRMLTGSGATWKAILVTNAVFSISHQHLGLGYSLMVFAPGLFWGWMFHRHQSMLGVAVSHVLIGLWGTGIIDLPSLLP